MSRHDALPFRLGFLALTLAGCVSHAVVGTDDGTSTGGAGAGGTTTHGAGAGGTNAGGTGDGGPAGCGSFDEPTATVTPTLRVTNARAQAIHFNKCEPRFVVIIDGQPRWGELVDWGMKTCEATLASGKEPCCGCEIEDEPLAPGETREITWSGLGYELVMLPEGCRPAGVTQCFQGHLPAPGPIQIVVYLFAGIDTSGQFAHPIDHFEVEQSFTPGSGASIDVVVN